MNGESSHNSTSDKPDVPIGVDDYPVHSIVEIGAARLEDDPYLTHRWMAILEETEDMGDEPGRNPFAVVMVLWTPEKGYTINPISIQDNLTLRGAHLTLIREVNRLHGLGLYIA